MIRWLLSCLFLIICPFSLFGASKDDPVFKGWPTSWIDAYLRFETFIEAKEKYWGSYNLEFLPNGEFLYYRRYVKREKRAGLSIESTYEGRRLPFIAKPPDEYFEFYPSMTASSVIKIGTEQGYQHGMPVVWYEITPDASANSTNSRHDKEGYTYSKLPIDGNNTDYYPNNRIILFYDFHIFPRGHPWDIYGENQRVSPSLSISINNNGLIERAELADPAAENSLYWIVYKDGRLIVNEPVNKALNLTPGSDTGSYVAFLAIQGPSGYMPVSNVLFYPLLPTTDGTTSLWPEDLNRNKKLDVLYLKFDEPNGLSPKEHFHAQQLWAAWNYDIYNFRMKKPEDFGWKKPDHGIKRPIPPPYSFTCDIDDSDNYVFTWRSSHPQGKVTIKIEEPIHSGNWNDLISFNYAQLAKPTDRNKYTVTLDKSMQLLSTEPPPRQTRLRQPPNKNFRLSEHRPFPNESESE